MFLGLKVFVVLAFLFTSCMYSSPFLQHGDASCCTYNTFVLLKNSTQYILILCSVFSKGKLLTQSKHSVLLMCGK